MERSEIRGENTEKAERLTRVTLRSTRATCYVHFNPVKHGLVSRVVEWPYSSFHANVKRGLLPSDWAGDVKDTVTDFGERKG